jgi:rhamnosyltransferase
MAKISIVIRCYNEERHIGRLLSGITQQTVKDTEIVVVDSGSTDSTVAVASRFPAKIVPVAPEDFSFGRSLNVGIEEARGDFVVLASAHVYPLYKDWIERLIKPFSDGKVALVYGKQRGGRGAKYSERQVFAKWYPDSSVHNQDHPFCNNANAAIRRSLWKRVRYDETLTGLEDLDWAKRIMALKYHVTYEADAEVVHVHNETWLQTYNRYRREALALKRIFPNEDFDIGDFFRLVATNVLSDFRFGIRDGLRPREWADIPIFRVFQFWGSYKGFSQHGPVTSQLQRRFYYPNGTQRRTGTMVSGQAGRAKVDYRKGEFF